MFSLQEVAAEYLPSDWTDGVRWLRRRLNAGELKGVRYGRTWRMRDTDIAYMVARYANDDQVVESEQPKPEPAQPVTSFGDALSPRSLRRLRRVQ